MIIPILLLVVGFVALILGANWLVDGATSVGIRAKLSPLIIGLTIVAFGTSLPELIINVFSCIKGSSGLAIGNIIGSNIMNILLILGVASIIYPIDVSRISIRRDIPAGFLATAALFLMANDFFTGGSHTINWIEGLVLLLMAGGYLYLTMVKNESPSSEVEAVQIPMPWWKTIVFLVLGILGLYIGGELVSNNAQTIAKAWGMSEAMIGLTVVAMATSLPELITSIVAATKKNSGIAIGNVLGSNILNIFVVLGVSGLITPLQFDSQMNITLGFLFLANLLMLLFVFTGKGRKLSRFEGFLMLLAFSGFMAYTILAR
ncbi:MAG: calcium/sodium antiporter [Bacteroidales bacterium]|nr:calcium/sodium antiporter [Bacteroidales bacterium]